MSSQAQRILFLEGFHGYEIGKELPYKSLEPIFAADDYAPTIWKPNWLKLPEDWGRDVLNELADDTSDPLPVLAGFSFGNFGSLIAASKRQIDRLIIASPSPYFKESNPKPEWLDGHEGHDAELLKAFQGLSITALASKIRDNVPEDRIHIAYGSEEPAELKDTAEQWGRALDVEPHELQGTGHDATSAAFMQFFDGCDGEYSFDWHAVKR